MDFLSEKRDRTEKLVDLYTPKGDDFLSMEELKKLTPEIVIERCRALKQPLREHAEEAERQRRPVNHLWDAIRKSGYFYLSMPKKYGGLEASPDQVVDATLPLAEGCGSTGWVAAFANLHNRLIVDFPVDFQDKIYGGGKYCIYAGATMPWGEAKRVEGGYRISGRFRWATCVTQADWVNLVAIFDTPEGKIPGRAMIPVGDGKVIDTWHTDGMRATGTHDFAVDNVFVPDLHTKVGLGRDGDGLGAKLYDNPIFGVPLTPLLTSTTTTVMVGIAKSAVELYHQRIQNHLKRGTELREAEKQAVQIRLAKVDTMVVTAELLLREGLRENLRGTELRGEAQVPFRSRIKAKFAMAVVLCREAVVEICSTTGTSIHFLDNPMQRILRDIMTGTSHITFDHDVVFEQHGRGMLGLKANTIIV